MPLTCRMSCRQEDGLLRPRHPQVRCGAPRVPAAPHTASGAGPRTGSPASIPPEQRREAGARRVRPTGAGGRKGQPTGRPLPTARRGHVTVRRRDLACAASEGGRFQGFAYGICRCQEASNDGVHRPYRSHPPARRVQPDPATVADLPDPEEVFGVRRIGPRELFHVRRRGPSLIALGISIGSGEWLLGPQAVGQYGFVGVGWVILVSAVLQTFYNVECSRYVIATGEVPVVGWAGVPPGCSCGCRCRRLHGDLRVHRRRLGRVGRAGRLRARPWRGAAGRAPRSRGSARSRLLVASSSSPRAAKKISRSLELANWVMVGPILSV